MTFTKEDITLIEKFIEIKNRGYYADGGQVTDVYNRVLEKRVAPTNCGSCIRGRISELEAALNRFKLLSEKAVEEPKQEEVNNVTPEENNESEKPVRRVGRPPKKS